MFRVVGSIEGRAVQATWDAGELEGDAHLLARVRALVDEGAQLLWPPVGPAYRAGLADPAAAATTIVNALLGAPWSIDGDVPEIAGEAVDGLVY